MRSAILLAAIPAVPVALRNLIAIIAAISFAPTAAEGMEFSHQFNGGNCGVCSWILAEGPIEDGATEKLKSFIAANNVGTAPNIRFNSPGGSVLEALKLGRFIRKSNIVTLVGVDFTHF